MLGCFRGLSSALTVLLAAFCITITATANPFVLNLKAGEIPGRIGIEVETGLAVGVVDNGKTDLILHGQPFTMINTKYSIKNQSAGTVELKDVGIKAEADGVGDADLLTRVSHVEFVVDPPVVDRYSLIRSAQVIQDGFSAAITALGDREKYCTAQRAAAQARNLNALDAKLRIYDAELVDDIVTKDGPAYDTLRQAYGVTKGTAPNKNTRKKIVKEQKNLFKPASVLKQAMVASARELYNDQTIAEHGTEDENHYVGINPAHCHQPFNRIMSEPQVTAGFHVSRIPFLFKVLANPDPYHARQIARDKCPKCAMATQLAASSMTALKNADQFFQTYVDEGKALEALLTLTTFYLNKASGSGFAHNVKISLANPALVKNSFDHVFRLMPQALKNHIRKKLTCKKFAKIIIDSIPSLKVTPGYDKYNSSIFADGFLWFVDPKPDSNNDLEKERLVMQIRPTNEDMKKALAKFGRQAWIENFCALEATDLLRTVKLKVKDVDPSRKTDTREAVIHDYAGRLIRHSKMTGVEEKLIVIELRETAKLQSAFNTITPWADAVYLAVSGVHTFDETKNPAPFHALESFGSIERDLFRVENGKPNGLEAAQRLKNHADGLRTVLVGTKPKQSASSSFLEKQPSHREPIRRLFRPHVKA